MNNRYCLNDIRITVPFVVKIIGTTPTVLGTSMGHQYFIFGCILTQIISILLVISIYYKQLIFSNVWWPLVESVRICVLAIIRIDQLITSEPNLFCKNNVIQLYKSIAFLNIFGFIWSFPIWIFYATLSLSNDNQSEIFFVITLIHISLRFICSIPTLSKIFEFATMHRNSMHENNAEFGYSFFPSDAHMDLEISASLNKEHKSPHMMEFDPSAYDEEDDPIMYTAPMDSSNNIDSMKQMIRYEQEKEKHQAAIQDIDDTDISDDIEKLQYDPEQSVVHQPLSEKQIDSETVSSESQ